LRNNGAATCHLVDDEDAPVGRREPSDAGGLIGREVAAPWGGACSNAYDESSRIVSTLETVSPRQVAINATRGRPGSCHDGANAMRLVFALGLLMALSASADAVTVHHARHGHHVSFQHAYSFRHAYGMVPRFVVPPRVYYNDTPSYDDPSKLGSG
jgi:hypothetical protein